MNKDMTMVQMNGFTTTTMVDGNRILMSRLRNQQVSVEAVAEVIEEVVEEPVYQSVQLPPASWRAPVVTHEVIHVDFGYYPEPKQNKPKKKKTGLQKLVHALHKRGLL